MSKLCFYILFFMVLGLRAGEFDQGWHLFDTDPTVLTPALKHDWLARRPVDSEKKPTLSGKPRVPGKLKNTDPVLHSLPVVDSKKHGVLSGQGIMNVLSLKASHALKKQPQASYMRNDVNTEMAQKELQNCRQFFLKSASELARFDSRQYKRAQSEYQFFDEQVEQLQKKPFISAQTVIDLGMLERQVIMLEKSLILQLGSLFFNSLVFYPLDCALKKLSHLRLLCSYAIVSQTNQMLKKRRVRKHYELIKRGKKIRDERIEEAKYVDF